MIERVQLLWRRFSPLEERLLAGVRQVLPEAAKALFDRQVAAINYVQRSPPSWSEICFYRRRRGKADWSGVPMFPCTDEFRLAELHFRAAGKSFKTTLTSIRGHIFDFVTMPGPKAVAFSPWELAPRVTLLGDPLGVSTGVRESERLPPTWQNVLKRVQIESNSRWIVHDEATTYRIALDRGEFLVLAERHGEEFILHRIEPEHEALFYMSGHDGVPETLKRDVEDLLRET